MHPGMQLPGQPVFYAIGQRRMACKNNFLHVQYKHEGFGAGQRWEERSLGIGKAIMTIGGFLVLLLVAGVCGAIAQSIVGYSHGGCLVSIALGFIGAMFGSWLAGLLGLPELFVVRIGGNHFPVLWSIVGAALFVALLSLLALPRRGPPP